MKIEGKKKSRPSHKQRRKQRQKEKKKLEVEEEKKKSPSSRRSNKSSRSRSKESRGSRGSRSGSRSNSKSDFLSHDRSRSFISDEGILRDEIQKENLNLSDFQEIEKLGGGRFSLVELAIYLKESKYVALKILDKKAYQSTVEKKHAFSEKRLLKDIRSPFKINYLGSFQSRKYLYLVTEYVEGCRLIDLVQQNKGLTEEAARFYGAQLLLFLETLHSHAAVFRDIKPENILISYWDRYLKVIDFGYSSYLDKETGTRETLCGTLEYLCPEKIQGVPYDTASDIWSFGILLFVMLCDRFPYKNPSQVSPDLDQDMKGVIPIMKSLSKEVPRLLRLHFKDRKQKEPLSSSIENLISSMLSFDPQKRPTISQIKKHEWFRSVDFKQMESKQITPPRDVYDSSLCLSEESL